MVWLLVVIATINGSASIATHEFKDMQICSAFAAGIRKQPHIEAAKCFAHITLGGDRG